MPSRKRQAPSTPKAEAGRRRSQRVGSSGKKSQYFEGSSDEDVESEDGRAVKRAKKSSANRKRKVESESEDDYDDAEEDGDEDAEVEDEEEEDSEVDEKPKGRNRGRKTAKASQNDEDEADEVEDGDEDGAPRVTFIPHKKLRDDGGVPYTDKRVHNNTMLFLNELKANNKRSWLKGKFSCA